MPLDLPQGHFANEQPAPYVRHFHDPRYGGEQHSDDRDGRNVRKNATPWQDKQSVPTSAPSAPAPFVGSNAMDFPVAAGVERVMNFERPQSENESLRYGSYAPTSSVSVAKPSAEESDALKTEAMKLIQDLQALVEDLDIDADKLVSERQKVEVRVAEIEAGSRNLQVFVEARIRPFLLMLEEKQNLIGYCEELNTTNGSLTAIEAELANAELHGKERDGVKAKRSGLRKSQRRLIEIIVALRASSRALDKFADGLLEEQYAEARDKKLHRRESFLQGREKQQALKKSRRLKSQFHEAGTPAYANEVNELLGNIGRYAMAVFGTQNLGPGKAKKRGFSDAKRAKRELQDEILQGNFGYEDEDEAGDQVTDSEMEAYEREYWDEIDAEDRRIDWDWDWDVDHLQRLTRERARMADLLSSRNRDYYLDSYPDLEGREARRLESREVEEAFWEAGRNVVPEVWKSLVNDYLPFDEVGPAFHDRLRAGYAEVDIEFAAQRLKELQAAWAALEGDEELAA